MDYRPCIKNDDIREWKDVVALIPDEGLVGDYIDGYGNYQYTQLDFTISEVPAIPEDLTFVENQLLFVTDGLTVRVKTQVELDA